MNLNDFFFPFAMVAVVPLVCHCLGPDLYIYMVLILDTPILHMEIQS